MHCTSETLDLLSGVAFSSCTLTYHHVWSIHTVIEEVTFFWAGGKLGFELRASCWAGTLSLESLYFW
jgi:hypothetical protein